MKRRPRIALFTALPEGVHPCRLTDGIMQQCEKYGYDLCVFASMVHLSFPRGIYTRGESNIYELCSFPQFDGIIIDTAAFDGDSSGRIMARFKEKMKLNSHIPVCALDMPIEGTHLVNNRNEPVLRELCRHVTEVHGCKKICILTGPKGNDNAESRLAVFLDEIEKHGLTVLPEHIIYGDFWYTSGDALADKLINKEISLPDAIICASDHMALGLIAKLVNNGIRVPDDVIVMGFDATEEGASSRISLSSYDSNDVKMGADAVDHLRSVIEPGAEIIPLENDGSQMFHEGASCGCGSDVNHTINAFRHALYFTARNYADPELTNVIDVGLLMETYVLEHFTASQTPEECMKNIYDSAFLLNPFSNFFLCLKENWLDIDDRQTDGYPETMLLTVANSGSGEDGFHDPEHAVSFPTSQMIPKLDEPREKPSAFFFFPVHFDGSMLGYAVLQRDISERRKITLVYRNWLRFVNSALEMIRSKQRLQTLSLRDEMTGAYNRRGMNNILKQLLGEAENGSRLFISVIDMDGLKYINDTFGHSEGDIGIKTICSVLMSLARGNEFCVRGGGDEFYLIGVGKYSDEDEALRIAEFEEALNKKSSQLGKPYGVSASIGCSIHDISDSLNVEDAMTEADEKMYRYKVARRRNRG